MVHSAQTDRQTDRQTDSGEETLHSPSNLCHVAYIPPKGWRMRPRGRSGLDRDHSKLANWQIGPYNLNKYNTVVSLRCPDYSVTTILSYHTPYSIISQDKSKTPYTLSWTSCTVLCIIIAFIVLYILLSCGETTLHTYIYTLIPCYSSMLYFHYYKYSFVIMDMQYGWILQPRSTLFC